MLGIIVSPEQEAGIAEYSQLTGNIIDAQKLWDSQTYAQFVTNSLEPARKVAIEKKLADLAEKDPAARAKYDSDIKAVQVQAATAIAAIQAALPAVVVKP